MDIHALLDLDRELLYWLNGSDSLFLDGVITALTSGFTWIPLYISLLYLIIKNNETMSQIGLIIGCCLFALILSDGMADFIMKPLVARWRPSNDPLLKYTIDIVDNLRGTQYGFFSAHASNTCSLSIFFCLLVRSKILSVSLVLWSLISCYTRVYLGLHYPGDIFFGLLWGAFAGSAAYLLYYKIYKKFAPKQNYISTQYTSTGYSLSDIDIVMSVFAFTLFYTIIYSLVR
jgi:membrane-associated phospholipid phosphatase